MTWHIKPLTEAPPVPWKNGGGLTRELMAWPDAQSWAWRVSVAEIARSGPFSSFDGVERWFAVMSGSGVRLEVGNRPHVAVNCLTPNAAPLSFAGDTPVGSMLIDGPTQALNLMLRGGAAEGCMVRISGDYATELNAAKTIAVYTISAGARVQLDGECLQLPPNTLAWRDCPAASRLQVHAAQALWMEIAC